MRILLRRLLKLSPNVPVSRDSQIYGAGVKATQKISTKKNPAERGLVMVLGQLRFTVQQLHNLVLIGLP